MVISISSSAYVLSIADDTPASAELSVEEYLHICTLKTAERSVEVVETAEIEIEPPIDISQYASEEELELIAQTVYGEGNGSAKIEQAAIVWCILNRVDTYGATIKEVITAPNQFMGYQTYQPMTQELYDLAVDVVTRYAREKNCEEDVGRVLPREYLWFSGDFVQNYFRNAYTGGTTWAFDCENPYIIG